MASVANEEWEVERRVVRTIISGNTASLQPNSGQPITIRGHNITVGCHELMKGTPINHRVWEWHGHAMTYEEMNGYSPSIFMAGITLRGCQRDMDEGRRMWRSEEGICLRAWSDMIRLFASSIAAITG